MDAAAESIRLLANPIAFRLLSTLYRHLGRLREAGLVSVVDERPARGAVERTYAVVASNSQLQREEVQTAPIAHVRAAVRNFIASLNANVLSFVGSRAFAKDRTQLRSFLVAADLTDEEYGNITRAAAPASRPGESRSEAAAPLA